MNWITAFLTSSIGRKLVMSITGLFLCSFLVVHCALNLLALVPDNGLLFNQAAEFMAHNILIRTIEIFLFAGILLHIIQSALLTRLNSKARSHGYSMKERTGKTAWYSVNMGILGSLILVFLVVHIRDFFVESRFMPEEIGEDVNGRLNMYSEVYQAFQSPVYSALYIVAIIVLAFHLLHGFQSAFRSLGIMHKKYTPMIRGLGVAYTALICGGFILIPIVLYFR
jgi:succinate dehydrogenase / fumarate reductase cytochrome b subunit